MCWLRTLFNVVFVGSDANCRAYDPNIRVSGCKAVCVYVQPRTHIVGLGSVSDAPCTSEVLASVLEDCSGASKKVVLRVVFVRCFGFRLSVAMPCMVGRVMRRFG